MKAVKKKQKEEKEAEMKRKYVEETPKAEDEIRKKAAKKVEREDEEAEMAEETEGGEKRKANEKGEERDAKIGRRRASIIRKKQEGQCRAWT